MQTQSRPNIRDAAPSDARTLAQLIDIAGEGIPNWLWSRSCSEGQTPLDVGTERALRPNGGFSYRKAMVAEAFGQPVGMVLSYAITEAPEDDPDDLPPPIAPFVALEKLSVGTWYINALAVLTDERGRGIGTQLMATAEGMASDSGFDVMSIQVYGQNTGAVRLYQRLGYEVVGQERVRNHPTPPFYTGDVLLLKKRLH